MPTPVVTAFVGDGSTAALNSNTLTKPVFAAVAVGTGCQITVTFRKALTTDPTPINPVITDSKSNTWLLVASGGSPNAPDYTFQANVAHALSPSGTPDTVTVTWTNNCDEIVLSGVQTVGGSLTLDGTPAGPTAMSAATSHHKSTAAPTATDVVIITDVWSGGPASQLTSVTGGTLVQVVGTPVNRAIAVAYNLPGVTTPVDTTFNWSASHAGTINAIAYTWQPFGTPTADAGPDQTHAVGKLVTLAGVAGGSYTSVTWRPVSKPTGSAAALSSTTIAGPTVTHDLPGNYVYGFITHNGAFNSPEDFVTIVAVAPSVSAGPDVAESTALPLPLLTAVVTGVGVTGSWAPTVGFTNPASVTITNPTNLSTPYSRPSLPGPYSFTFSGTDEGGNPVSDTVVHTYSLPSAVADNVEYYNAATGQWS
jgi:hypothetical protein